MNDKEQRAQELADKVAEIISLAFGVDNLSFDEVFLAMETIMTSLIVWHAEQEISSDKQRKWYRGMLVDALRRDMHRRFDEYDENCPDTNTAEQ